MPRVETTFPGGYKTRSIVHGVTGTDYEFCTDYSKPYGGEGSAPTPWDTFLAALMACQSVHVRNFCAEHDIPTENLKLQLDLVTAEDNREVLDFQVHILFPKEFPEELRDGALYAARHCKVVQHLLDFHPVVTYTTEIQK